MQCCDHVCCTTKWFSYTYTHIHSPSESLPTRIITEFWVEFSALHGRSLLAKGSINHSVHVPIPNPQSIPPLFAYIKKRKPHDVSYRTRVMLELDLEACLENVIDGKAAWRAAAMLGGMPASETVVLSLPGYGNEGEGQTWIEHLHYLCSFMGALLATFHRGETQGSNLWKDLPWVTDCNHEGGNSVSDSSDSWGQAVCVMPFHRIQRSQSRTETSILRSQRERISIFTKKAWSLQLNGRRVLLKMKGRGLGGKIHCSFGCQMN